MDQSECSNRRHCEPWNKGKLVGQKAPLRLKEIWVESSSWAIFRCRPTPAARAEIPIFYIADGCNNPARR